MLDFPLCRCNKPCTDGTYGDSCRFLCKTCYHGHCDHVTGSCVCLPGFHGERWGYSDIYRLFLLGEINFLYMLTLIWKLIAHCLFPFVVVTTRALFTSTVSTALLCVTVGISPAIRAQGLAHTVCTIQTLYKVHISEKNCKWDLFFTYVF